MYVPGNEGTFVVAVDVGIQSSNRGELSCQVDCHLGILRVSGRVEEDWIGLWIRIIDSRAQALQLTDILPVVHAENVRERGLAQVRLKLKLLKVAFLHQRALGTAQHVEPLRALLACLSRLVLEENVVKHHQRGGGCGPSLFAARAGR